jgi:hypothetical protein
MSTVAGWKPGLVLQAIDLTPAIIMAIKAALSPAQTVAITMWREAESRFEHGRWVPNPIDAMVDVLEVIDYRASDGRPRWRDRGHKGICLERWAFSCWEPKGGPDDPRDADHLAENFEAVMHVAQKLLAGVQSVGKLLDCMAAAEACLGGSLVHSLPENTTHYHADWITRPDWAFFDKARTRPRTPVARRHGHLFYAAVP